MNSTLMIVKCNIIVSLSKLAEELFHILAAHWMKRNLGLGMCYEQSCSTRVCSFWTELSVLSFTIDLDKIAKIPLNMPEMIIKTVLSIIHLMLENASIGFMDVLYLKKTIMVSNGRWRSYYRLSLEDIHLIQFNGL